MKNLLYFTISSLFLLSLYIVPIMAQGTVEVNPITTNQTLRVIQTRADQIERQYRVVFMPTQDVHQYRDWNATRGKWVQEDWITFAIVEKN